MGTSGEKYQVLEYYMSLIHLIACRQTVNSLRSVSFTQRPNSVFSIGVLCLKINLFFYLRKLLRQRLDSNFIIFRKQKTIKLHNNANKMAYKIFVELSLNVNSHFALKKLHVSVEITANQNSMTHLAAYFNNSSDLVQFYHTQKSNFFGFTKNNAYVRLAACSRLGLRIDHIYGVFKPLFLMK